MVTIFLSSYLLHISCLSLTYIYLCFTITMNRISTSPPLPNKTNLFYSSRYLHFLTINKFQSYPVIQPTTALPETLSSFLTIPLISTYTSTSSNYTLIHSSYYTFSSVTSINHPNPSPTNTPLHVKPHSRHFAATA